MGVRSYAPPLLILVAIACEPWVSPRFVVPVDDAPALEGVFVAPSRPENAASDLLAAATNATRVVVVGSSGSLRGRGRGAFVDGHDIVVRVNGAPVGGYEDDVGNRTDVRVAWEGGLLDGIDRDVGVARLATLLVTTSLGAHATAEASPATDALPSVIAVANTWTRRLFEHQLGENAVPSTGFQALAFAIAWTTHVGAPPPTAVGFGACSCVHYYDCHGALSEHADWMQDEMLGVDGGHAFATEAFLRQRWHEAGVIRLVDDGSTVQDVQAATEARISVAQAVVVLVVSVAIVAMCARSCDIVPRLSRLALRGALQSWYVAGAVAMMAMGPFLVSMTRNAYGGYDYTPFTVLLTIEAVKLLVATGLAATSFWSVDDGAAFAAPAILYTVNNYIVFVALRHCDAGSFQVLSSLKILFTALLLRLVHGRPMGALKTVGLVLLACGASTLDVKDGDSEGAVLLSVLSCFLSSAASVHAELLLKRKGGIHAQNVCLYGWCCVFNLCILLRRYPGALLAGGYFDGYTPWVWLLVCNNALLGLTLSAILKYADNLVRVYAQVVATVMTVALQTMAGIHTLDVHLATAIVVIACSVYVYNHKDASLLLLQDEERT